jgi:sporulation protein YlmC with PRC-barrel domain
MKKSFINKFKVVYYGQIMDIHMGIKTNTISYKTITDQEVEQIKKQLLKDEYISKITDNQIVIETDKHKYVLTYYDKFVTLSEYINYFASAYPSKTYDYKMNY